MGTEIQISFGILIGFLKNRTTWYTAGSTTDIGPILVYSIKCFIVLRILRHSKGLNHQDGTLSADCKQNFPWLHTSWRDFSSKTPRKKKRKLKSSLYIKPNCFWIKCCTNMTIQLVSMKIVQVFKFKPHLQLISKSYL